MSRDVACIVLAAGGSSRFGASKQLGKLNGETLIHRAVRAAYERELRLVVVVTGADSGKVAAAVSDYDAIVIRNHDWQSGLASSIVTGLQQFKNLSRVDGVLITLADQPLVDSSSLLKLLSAFDSTHRIVAAGYSDTIGVPVVIGREYVPDLMRLEGDRGAGQWLKSRQQDLTVVSMPEASIDVDTVDDLHQLENDVRVSPTRSHGFS